MKMVPIWVLAALLCSGAAPAQPAARLLPAQSEIVFTSRQMGVPVDGRFKTFDAQIAFDPKQPEAGTVALHIDTGSATLGLAEADAELVKAPWFNAPKFPQATFQSRAIKALGGAKFDVSGQLTLKGSVQSVTVPVLLTPAAGGTTVATGGFTLKRLEFRIGEAEWADTAIVANEVQVRFKLTLSGLGPP